MSSGTVRLSGLLGLWILAAWLRVEDLGQGSALGDAIHPWWAALRDGWPRPHASPYGWALVLPYKLCLLGAADLWDAARKMAVLHSLVAPIGAWLAWRLSGRTLSAGIIGLLLALDPGLLDTTRSGAEGYLAPVWIGVMLLSVTSSRPWVRGAAPALWALALMHHPMALAAGPLLAGLKWRARHVWIGAGVAVVMLLPRATRLWTEGLPGGAGQGSPMDAPVAYLAQGEWIAIVILLGPCVGLVSPRTRPLAVRTLAGVVLLAALGLLGGYLRDHHLRLLTVPALLGWAAVPWPGLAAVLAGLLVPRLSIGPPDIADAPGSLGLARSLTDQIIAEAVPPLVVDGAWLSGGPAASPAAVMLDLHLRGWSSDELQPGHTVVVIVSGDREEVARLSPAGLQMVKGDRHALLMGQPVEVARWSEAHCDARLGGAWDALSVLHPTTTVDEARAWWACR